MLYVPQMNSSIKPMRETWIDILARDILVSFEMHNYIPSENCGENILGRSTGQGLVSISVHGFHSKWMEYCMCHI